jgi:hypothetical protein
MKLTGLLILFCALFLPLNLRGEEQFSLFESVRARARGGTGVASFGSGESQRMNPAALAETDPFFELRLLKTDFFVAQHTKNTIVELVKTFQSENLGVDFLHNMDNKFGKHQYTRGELELLSLRLGGFQVTPFAQTDTWLELHNPSLPNMAWEASARFGAAISYARAFGNLWLAGLTVRPFRHYYLAGDVTFTDIMDFIPPSEANFEDYAPLREGSGVAVDLGFLFRPSKNFRLGATAQNIGDAGYTGKSDRKPPNLPQILSLGGLYRLSAGRLNIDLAGDYQGIVNPRGFNLTRLMHYGVELGSSFFHKEDNDWAVAVGVNEGYISYGAFIDFWLGRLGFSRYAVELGTYPGQRPDYREAMSFDTKIAF